MKVSDVMTHNVVTVGPGTPLKDVSRVLLERRISGVPVVEGGRVVGVVSNRDILFKEREPEIAEEHGLLGRLLGRRRVREEDAKAEARNAEEAMSSPGSRFARVRGSRRPRRACSSMESTGFRSSRTESGSARSSQGIWSASSRTAISSARSPAELLVDQVKRVPGVVAVHSRLAWRELEPDLRDPTTTMTDRI